MQGAETLTVFRGYPHLHEIFALVIIHVGVGQGEPLEGTPDVRERLNESDWCDWFIGVAFADTCMIVVD